MAAVLGQSSQENTQGLPLDCHLFPYEETGTDDLPAIDFPEAIVVAPREEELDVTWNSADYARALPRLCSADLLGLAIEASQERMWHALYNWLQKIPVFYGEFSIQCSCLLTLTFYSAGLSRKLAVMY